MVQGLPLKVVGWGGRGPITDLPLSLHSAKIWSGPLSTSLRSWPGLELKLHPLDQPRNAETRVGLVLRMEVSDGNYGLRLYPPQGPPPKHEARRVGSTQRFSDRLHGGLFLPSRGPAGLRRVPTHLPEVLFAGSW